MNCCQCVFSNVLSIITTLLCAQAHVRMHAYMVSISLVTHMCTHCVYTRRRSCVRTGADRAWSRPWSWPRMLVETPIIHVEIFRYKNLKSLVMKLVIRSRTWVLANSSFDTRVWDRMLQIESRLDDCRSSSPSSGPAPVGRCASVCTNEFLPVQTLLRLL